MTIKFGNFANFIVRNFVVIWDAPNKALLPPLPPLPKEYIGGMPGKRKNGILASEGKSVEG